MKLRDIGINQRLRIIPRLKGMVFLGAFLFTTGIFANPVLDHVAAGDVTIQQTPQSTVVNQSSQHSIVNWSSFNIANGETTHFQQPVGGVTLNRINPQQGASAIYGSLTATGQVILVNPAGIHFGPSAYVNVGGLIATTANIADQDFLSGHYHFSQASPYANAAIINEGQIIAANHGLIAIVAPYVMNKGLIQAHLGNVILASGNTATINFDGMNLIHFAINEKTNHTQHGITNTGSLIADGGTILVTAKAAQGVLDQVINLEGVVQARSFEEHKGDIILSGDEDAGIVRVAATLDASGKTSGLQGGNVTVTGYNILLDAPTLIDVSGDQGGGHIYVGGNYQGKGPLPNANATVMMANTTLLADALTQGNGGEIILWGNTLTKAYGTIQARGGTSGGDGGFIETSSPHYLDVNGIHVDTSAPNGTAGMWLLDPADLTISSGADSNVTGSSPFTATAASAVLNVTTLTNALASGSVTVRTSDDGFAGNGDITVADAITWSAATTLNLTAVRNIVFNASVTGGLGSSLTLNATNVEGSITTSPTATIDIGTLNLQQGGMLLGAANTLSTNVSVVLTGTSILDFNGFSQSLGAITGASGNQIKLGAGDMTINRSLSTTYAGTISGSGSINKGGTGRLTLTGDNSSYTGAISINQGTIRATNNNSALGTTANGTTVASGASLELGNIASAEPVTISGTGASGSSGALASNTVSASLSGNVTLAGDATIGSPVAFTISGIINDGASSYAITKVGSNTLTLSGANTYNGSTTINAGTLRITNVNALGSGSNMSSSITVGSGTTLTFATAGTIGNTNTITLGSGGSATLQFDNAGIFSSNPIVLASDSTITGLAGASLRLSGQITGSSGLTVSSLASSSDSSLFLNNSNNTYTGATLVNHNRAFLSILDAGALGNGSGGSATSVTVNAGTLHINFNNATLGNTNDITINGSGVVSQTTGALYFAGTGATISNNVIMGSNSSIGGASGTTNTLSGVLSGAFDLTKTVAGTVVLSGANTYSGSTTVSTGTLRLGATTGLGNTTGTTVSSGAALDINFNSAALGNTNTITLNGTGISSAGALTFTGTGSTLSNAIALGSNSSLGGTGSGTLSGVVSGGFNLSKVGASTITLSGANTYSGSTTISAGTLSLGATTALGNTTGTTVASGAALNIAFNSGTLADTDTITLNGTGISSGGALTFTGTGSTLDNPIVLGSNSSIGATGAGRLGGIISGNFDLSKVSSGTLTLSTANTYTGSTSIDAGTLTISHAQALGSSASGTTINSGATLSINSVTGFNEPLTLSSGTITVSGTSSLDGAITLANSSTNTITVNAGNALTINNAINGGGALSSQGNGTLTLASTLGNTTRLTSLTLDIDVTLAGATTINTTGNQTYNNPITLGAASTLDSSLGNVSINNTVNGGFNFTVSSAGSTTLADIIGGTTPLASLTAGSTSINLNSGSVTTTGSQTYNSAVVLGANTQLTSNSGGNITLNHGVSGNKNLTFTGGTTGTYNFNLGGTLALTNVTVTGNSSNNTFSLNTTNNQTFSINANNAGTVSGVSGVSGNINFSGIQNLTGSASHNNTFLFANNAIMNGTLDGSSIANTNTLNYTSYSSALGIIMTGLNDGYVQNNANTITTFRNINNIATTLQNQNAFTLPNKANSLAITGPGAASMNDPVLLSGIINFHSASGRDSVTIPAHAIVNASKGTITIDGVTMYFFNFNLNTTTGGVNNTNVAEIIQQPISNSDSAAPQSQQPTWVTASETLVGNLDDITSQEAQTYEDDLNKTKVNPYCMATS